MKRFPFAGLDTATALSTIMALSGMTLSGTASAQTTDTALQALSSYNVFVDTNVGTSTSHYTSDFEGATVIGGNGYFSNFSMATNAQANGYGLIVGGALTLSGTINGNVYVGGSPTVTTTLSGYQVKGNLGIASGSVTLSNGSVTGTYTHNSSVTSPLNIAATWNNLAGESTLLGKLSTTTGDTAVSQYGGLTLTGVKSATGLDVFNLNASQFSNINDFTLNAPAGTTVLINVTGTSVTWNSGGYSLSKNLSASNVLFNFVNATSVTLGASGGEYGSILAPLANLNGSNGHLDGSIVAKSFTGSLQVDSGSNFSSSVLPTPLPGSLVLFASALAAVGGYGWRSRHHRVVA